MYDRLYIRVQIDLARGYFDICTYCIQAYSSLGSADRPWLKEGSLTSGPPTTGYEVLAHPAILKLAEKYGKTSANIVIRWHLQMNGCLVCKSITPSRYL